MDGAVRLVPGARWAGISMIHGRVIEARVPSDPLVKRLDELQSTLKIPAGHVSRRPPAVSASQAACPSSYFVRKSNFGALNLYADEPSAFDEESKFIRSVLAQHASVAMAASASEVQ